MADPGLGFNQPSCIRRAEGGSLQQTDHNDRWTERGVRSECRRVVVGWLLKQKVAGQVLVKSVLCSGG